MSYHHCHGIHKPGFVGQMQQCYEMTDVLHSHNSDMFMIAITVSPVNMTSKQNMQHDTVTHLPTFL